MADSSTALAGGFTVRSEARGPHWIAWLTRGQDSKPVRDVVLVGETQDEAESRARQWLQEATSRGYVQP